MFKVIKRAFMSLFLIISALILGVLLLPMVIIAILGTIFINLGTLIQKPFYFIAILITLIDKELSDNA